MDAVRPVEVLNSITDAGSSIYSMEYNQDDSFLAYGKNDGTVCIVDTNLEKIQEIDTTSPMKMPVSTLKWKPSKGLTKNTLLVSSSEGTISEYHSVSGNQINSFHLPGDDYGSCCDFSPDAESFALGCKEGRIRIFDDMTKQETQELRKTETRVGHSNLILTLKWHSQNTLVSGSMDGSVIIWDVRSSSMVKFFTGISFYGDSLDIMGDYLLTADTSNSEQVKLWSLSQGKLIASLSLVQRKRPFRAYVAQFSKSGSSSMAFIGGNGFVQGYYIDAGTLSVLGGISCINQPIYTCDFSNHSTARLAIGSSDGTLSLIYLNSRGPVVSGLS